MPGLKQWLITAERRGWNGYAAVAIGDGSTVNDALKDAGNLIGSAFRPKQDGREGVQLSVTIRRPDGSQFNVHPHALKDCDTPAELEAARATDGKLLQAKSKPGGNCATIAEWLEKNRS